MPKELEEKFRRQGRKKGLTGKRLDAYTYGALRLTGWVPSTQKKDTNTQPKKGE